MRGNATLKRPGYLPTLFGGGGAPSGASLLAALSGQIEPPPLPASPAEALRRAEAGAAKAIAEIAAEPTVRREIASFASAVAAAKTPARLLAVPAVLKILLTVHGLADQADNTARAISALLSDPRKPEALVHHLPDPRWLRANRACAFATRGLGGLRPSEAITKAYVEALWHQRLDRTVPGLSRALVFLKQAAALNTGRFPTPDRLLSDPAVRAVLTVAVGLPDPVAFQPAGARNQAIAGRIEVTRLRDPAFARDIAERYLSALTEGPKPQPAREEVTPARLAG